MVDLKTLHATCVNASYKGAAIISDDWVSFMLPLLSCQHEARPGMLKGVTCRVSK